MNAVYNIGDQDQVLNNIINETYNPAGQHNYIYDQQVQYMVHGTWYMQIKHFHKCICTNRYMVHACPSSTLMSYVPRVHDKCLCNIFSYVCVTTGTWYMYNIFTYVYVPIRTWCTHVQYLHICICTNRYMVHTCTLYNILCPQVHGTYLYNINTHVYVP